MPPNDEETPQTLEELFEYILRYADDIYVRAQRNGKWENVALSELPATEALQRAFQWVLDRHIPVRVLKTPPPATKPDMQPLDLKDTNAPSRRT